RLVYVSAWLKCHHPAAFTAALLNSQPMGFYSPRALIEDARRHGVRIHPVDVQYSSWDSDLEPCSDSPGEWALRLGLRQVRGLREEHGLALTRARGTTPFRDLGDLQRRSGLARAPLQRLARAHALRSLHSQRRQAVWNVQALHDAPLFRGLVQPEPEPPLPEATPYEELEADYRTTGHSVQGHPLSLVRAQLEKQGAWTARQVLDAPDRCHVRVAGLVSHRQRPSTAQGIVFMTLEDETGLLNLVVKPPLFQRQRQLICGQDLLQVRARVQRDGDSVSLLALSFSSLRLPGPLPTRSRNFH
ncbi:MAG: OB-fold nucleic acid binding domain-containing protein, partial [Myxococcota bacterium]|nr:OB-fold nucleic acid binding domain-containing protein [Myxococcota bacterium]